MQHGQGSAEGEAEAGSKADEWLTLLPRLTRFYGIGPSDFLRLPVGLFRRYVEMLPRLIAEESLTAMQRVAMGSGNMKEQDAKRIGQSWERMANPKPEAFQKTKADPAAMAAAGIKVKAVKRNES